jgi:ubiquinone/menaquinone biosynthesis C-methylase UbiE
MERDNHADLKNWEKSVASTYFPPNAKILDIGCGMGREAFRLYDMGFNPTGVDISEKAIKAAYTVASESNRHISFLITNGLDLPFRDNSFAVVIIWAQTLGIVYNENNQTAFLTECHRVLKTGGIISFSGHDREYLESKYPQFLSGKKFFPFADHRIHWEMFTENEMKELALKSGFWVLNCEKGTIYREEDGTILHCECVKPK